MSDDLLPGALYDFKFTTVDGTGLPTVLTGSPSLACYKLNDTTQTTTGLTLTASFDAVTGLNHVRVDTAADGTFYSAGADFDVVIAAGTVGGVSVVGYTVGHFSLARIPDAILTRDWTAITATVPARCAFNALRLLRNGWAIVAGTLRVKKEDDSTDAWTSTLTGTAGVDPITESDPT